MKKIVILIVVFALALALTGCGRTITPRHSAEYLFTDANGYAPSEIAEEQTFTVIVPGGTDDETAEQIIVNNNVVNETVIEETTINETVINETTEETIFEEANTNIEETVINETIFEEANIDDTDAIDDADTIDDADNADIDADSEDIFEDERTGDEPDENGWYDYIYAELEWLDEENNWDYSNLPDYAARIEGVEPDIVSEYGYWEYYSNAHVLVFLSAYGNFGCDNSFVKNDCEAIMFDLPSDWVGGFCYYGDFFNGSEYPTLTAVYLDERINSYSFTAAYEVDTYYAMFYPGTLDQFCELCFDAYPDASQFDNIHFYVDGEDLGVSLSNNMYLGTNSWGGDTYYYAG